MSEQEPRCTRCGAHAVIKITAETLGKYNAPLCGVGQVCARCFVDWCEFQANDIRARLHASDVAHAGDN